MTILIRRIFKHLIILWSFGTVLLSITTTGTPVHASSAVIAVNPATISDTTLTLGSTFSIIVTIADVQQLWGYQFILRYNASVINATDFVSLDSRFTLELPSEIGRNCTFVSRATYNGDTQGITSTTPIPVDRIDFIVTGYGATALRLDPVLCQLANTQGNEIEPLLLVDGWFSNTFTYNELLSSYLALNSTYYQLLAEHNELSASYTTLQSDYNDLTSQHNSLNSEYDELQNSYQLLQGNYTDLKEQYGFSQGEASVFRNFTYVLAVIAIASVGATVYFAVKKRGTTP